MRDLYLCQRQNQIHEDREQQQQQQPQVFLQLGRGKGAFSAAGPGGGKARAACVGWLVQARAPLYIVATYRRARYMLPENNWQSIIRQNADWHKIIRW
jgi:hypothetical protein